jgi:hypothetical protein
VATPRAEEIRMVSSSIERTDMNLIAFLETTWRLLIACGLIATPLWIVIALALVERRRQVRRMHYMRQPSIE